MHPPVHDEPLAGIPLAGHGETSTGASPAGHGFMEAHGLGASKRGRGTCTPRTDRSGSTP